MNFTINKTLPVGISKFEWYTKLVNAVLLFTPNNARYIVVGPQNSDIFKFSRVFILNKNSNNSQGRYLFGKLGNLDVYVDQELTNEVKYEVRASKEDFMNETDSGTIYGQII